MPISPYPHPRSRTLSAGPKWTFDSNARLPESAAWGENSVGAVSNSRLISATATWILMVLACNGLGPFSLCGGGLRNELQSSVPIIDLLLGRQLPQIVQVADLSRGIEPCTAKPPQVAAGVQPGGWGVSCAGDVGCGGRALRAIDTRCIASVGTTHPGPLAARRRK